MPKKIDETGNIYGKLTVIKESDKANGVYWECLCECGETRIAPGTALRRGEITGCRSCSRKAMGNKLIDETGHVHNKLTVIERAENDKWNKPQWKCRCECGTYTIASGEALRSGRKRSCGCLKTFQPGVAAFRAAMRHMYHNAQKRGLEFSLTRSQVRSLVQQPCYYCGAAPSQVSRTQSGNGEFVYNGLDRIDNSKGYIRENVVPCCGHCNTAKLELSQSEFSDKIKQIYHHWAAAFDG